MSEKIILLVEDNPSDEALTLRAFPKNNISSTVVVKRDGAEALDYLLMRRSDSGGAYALPQLILLGLNPPKIDGLEVLRRIRADKIASRRNPHIVSGRYGSDQRLRARGKRLCPQAG